MSKSCRDGGAWSARLGLQTIGRFAGLTRERRAFVVTAAILQIGARLFLRVTDIRRVDALATWIGRRRSRIVDTKTLAWALTASAPRVGGTCLTQALAARVLLGWSGRASSLVIGVSPGSSLPGPRFNDRFSGALRPAGTPTFHAWTETGGLSFPADAHDCPFTALVTWS